MDDFSTPNLVNAFGYVPSMPNYIRPGKRPMSSMSPIIILDKTNNVRLVLGASGGSRIISSVAQVALKNLFIDNDIKRNIDDKRVHHQLYPEHVEIDMGFSNVSESTLGTRKYFF
jgi:gamma-glutamyltranspeptidase/glutathione hydrolase/leukotriene-C4 hydrolase